MRSITIRRRAKKLRISQFDLLPEGPNLLLLAVGTGASFLMGAYNGLRPIIILVVLIGPAHATCVDPAQLTHSTVGIARHFDQTERGARPDLVGIQGTGWFLSPTTIVTVAHVAVEMKLSTDEWKPLEIMDENGSQLIGARIQRQAGHSAEKLALIELQQAAPATHVVVIRKEPLVPEEQVTTLVYTEGLPHLVGGRFVRFGDQGLAGSVLLEMYEGNDRLVIDHGASGAPVVDCQGRVAAVISNIFTQNWVFASDRIRISTAWGSPNVLSVPIQALDDPG